MKQQTIQASLSDASQKRCCFPNGNYQQPDSPQKAQKPRRKAVFSGCQKNLLSSFCALLCFLWLNAFSFFLSAAESSPSADLLLVIGAPGTDAYGNMFQTWADRWLAAAKKGNAEPHVVGRTIAGDASDRDRIEQLLKDAAGESHRPLWIVLIGHGTFDRKTARFNLRGPDISANDLAEWLQPLKRPVAVVDCSASSAPFLIALSAENRVVLTATKSGGEENFSRFGEFLAKSIDDPDVDLDKDGQTSLWEAYLAASRRTAEFYQSDGRLQTEHALLDDNGDQQGSRADLFHGLQLKDGLTAANPVDGVVAHQWHLVPSDADAKLPPEVVRRRNELELAIVKLRGKKADLDAEEYDAQLEELLVELARLNRSSEPEASATDALDATNRR